MLHLSILSPERKLFLEVQVNEVTLPSSEGQIQILPWSYCYDRNS